MMQAVTLCEKGIWLKKFLQDQYSGCYIPTAVFESHKSLYIEFYI